MTDIKVQATMTTATDSEEEIIEIDIDEWNECECQEERDDLMNEYAKSWAGDYVEDWNDEDLEISYKIVG